MTGMRSLLFTLAVAAVFTCLTPVKAVSDCSSRVERADAYEKCFNDQGLEAPEIFESYRRATDTDVEEVPVEELYDKHGADFCANHTVQFKAAVRCAYQIDFNCDDALTKMVMPSPDTMAKSVDALCRDIEDIDFTCAKQQETASASCVSGKAKQLSDIKDAQQLICKTLSISAECVKEQYKKCGCATSKAYSNVIYDVLMPKTCSNSKRVTCNPTNKQEFVSDGLNSGGRLGFAMSLLTVSLIFQFLALQFQ